MSMEMSEFQAVFFSECNDHLEDMEQCLLDIDIENISDDEINRLFRAAHSIKGGSGMFGYTAVTGLTHIMETLLGKARTGELSLTTLMVDTLLLSLDQVRIVLNGYQLGELVDNDSVADSVAALEALVEQKPSPSEPEFEEFGLFTPIEGTADTQTEPEVEEFDLFTPIERTPDKSAASEPTQSAPSKIKAATAATIRVDTNKIDMVMNQLGELVITQSVLRNLASQTSNQLASEFEQALDSLGFQLRELQESALSMRMLPISNLFTRFNRLVRDSAKSLNKQVKLDLQGMETEIDKTMIEKLSDPLTHLIRNAIDHGIEPPTQRQEKGKPETGQITLSAFQQGSAIAIQLQDDGAGLNRDKILEKAAEKGLAVSRNMTDDMVWRLIFEPGFSTASQVSDLSGRGVGMDVVKRNIEILNGTINIDSTADAGSTFTMLLPLTLAILDGMKVKVGEDTFILPLHSIVESFQPSSEQVKRLGNQPVILHREHYWPILSLAACMGSTSQECDLFNGIVVLLNAPSMRVALLVDDLVGQQQIVIKSLKKNYKSVPNVSAATILGDGSVSFILDVEQLAKQVAIPKEFLEESNEPSSD